MNYRKSLALLIPIFMLFACNSAEEKEQNIEIASVNPEKTEQFSKSFHLEKNDEACTNANGECTQVLVEFNYPEGVSAENHRAISQFFEKQATASLQANLEGTNLTSLDKLADAFILEYQKFKDEMEDKSMAFPWLFQVDGTITNQTAEWLRVELNEYTFTGGAHGNYQKIIRSFSSSDQHVFTYADLGISKAYFSQKMEEALRLKYDLSPEASLSDVGLWFEDNTFQPNENYAIRNDSIIMLYNPYEIAAYSEGIIEITLPLSHLEEVI